MDISRSMAIVIRQSYLIRGSISRVLPLFIWAAIDIVLWGFISKYLNSLMSSRLNLLPTLLGAVLLWDFLTRVMQGVTMTFFEDVWSRNFLNLFSTPLTVPEYLTGLVLSSIGSSSVGLVIMVLLATGVFGLSFATYGLMIAPFLLVLFMCGIALGIFGCSLVLRLGPPAEWFVWPIPAIISPFVGVFYPLSVLPRWMRMISRLLPPSYVFEGMRGVVSDRTASPADVLWGASLAGVYIFLACWFFACVYRHALKTGLIARYSAETLS